MININPRKTPPPDEGMFVFVTRKLKPHLGFLKEGKYISLTEKGKEYKPNQIKYWIQNQE